MAHVSFPLSEQFCSFGAAAISEDPLASSHADAVNLGSPIAGRGHSHSSTPEFNSFRRVTDVLSHRVMESEQCISEHGHQTGAGIRAADGTTTCSSSSPLELVAAHLAPLRGLSVPAAPPSDRCLRSLLGVVKYLSRQEGVAAAMVAGGAVPLLAAFLDHDDPQAAEQAAGAVKELCYKNKEVGEVF